MDYFTHGEIYRTDKLVFAVSRKFQFFLQKVLSMQKSITNSFVSSTNRFVEKTENLLGKEKSFVSSISTIWLVNTTIFFSPCVCTMRPRIHSFL